jgi:hypothetical protein
MATKLEKKLKRINVYEIVCLAIIIVYLLLFFVTSVAGKTVNREIEAFFIAGTTFSTLVYPIMYFGIWRGEIKHIEYLLYTDKKEYIEDISFEKKTFSADI